MSLSAMLCLSYHDGVTEFIGTDTEERTDPGGGKYLVADTYYAVMASDWGEDTERSFYVWKLPPPANRNEEFQNHHGQSVATPDFIVNYSDVDWEWDI